MSWLENLGLILVLLVFSMAFFSVTRVDRVITYWFWAWAAQLAAAVLLGTHPDASIAHATGRGLALLAPALQLCGALVYVGRPVARWIVPLGVALVGARVLLYTLGPADLERVLATCVEVGAYTCALVLVAQGGGSTNWTGRCLILGYAGLLSVEIYDLVVELHSQADHVAWTLWVVVGVFMGATQIQVAFRRARTTNDRNDQLAARTAMDRFDALVRHSKDIVAEVGSDGRLSYVSPNVERHLGYHPDELIGRSMRGLLTPARADWQSRNESRTAVDLGALVAAGPYDTLYQALTKRGERRWLEIQASHYFTPNAEIRAVAIIRDVTERETLHRQHLESQNLESLGVLAGGIAHDFNNLLTAIIGNIGIARESMPAGSAADAPLEQIDKAASRAAQLTSKLLAYAGNVPATPTTVDVVQVTDEMQHMLDTAISKKVHLSWKRPQGPMLADADPTLLTQVIMNLMTNASEALDGLPGNIELVVDRVEVTDTDDADPWWVIAPPPGCYITITVSDDGAGMDEETRQRIFDPFFSRKFVGRGLGLSAVLGIVRGHGGGLRVNSAVGAGSTFSVLLPEAESAAPLPVRESPGLPAWRGDGLALVVDDEEIVRDVLQRMLQKIGFDVVSASEGRDAVAMIAERGHEVRFILLDVTMPGMSLSETISGIHQHQADVPIILMSGYTAAEVAAGVVSSGVSGFLHKPFQLDAVSRAIQVALQEAKSQGQFSTESGE